MRILINIKKVLVGIFSRKAIIPSIDDKKNCLNCKFNNGRFGNCTVGSYYAENGLTGICFEGELWESTKIN